MTHFDSPSLGIGFNQANISVSTCSCIFGNVTLIPTLFEDYDGIILYTFARHTSIILMGTAKSTIHVIAIAIQQ